MDQLCCFFYVILRTRKKFFSTARNELFDTLGELKESMFQKCGKFDMLSLSFVTVEQMVERINWMADRSEKGLNQSGGIMVNYVYR